MEIYNQRWTTAEKLRESLLSFLPVWDLYLHILYYNSLCKVALIKEMDSKSAVDLHEDEKEIEDQDLRQDFTSQWLDQTVDRSRRYYS